MLSLTRVSSKQAINYYKVDDYYLQTVVEWEGSLGVELGYTNTINETEFHSLVQGIDPQGRFQVQSGGHNYSHTAGVDLTFSAPKSVSIAGLVLDDKRILAAHDKAVSDTLKYIEYHYAQVRIKKDGMVHSEPTGNLLAAKFQHVSSRELDPQLHTHCLVLNMTRKADGTVRAMDFGEIFANKMLLGQVYRSELAANLKDLGYQIKTSSKGLFEIDGVESELLNEFSSRSEQIKIKLEQLRSEFPFLSESKLREMATLDSRQTKQEIGIKELKLGWDKRVAGLSLDKETILTDLTTKIATSTPRDKPDTTHTIDELLQNAIDIATEHAAVIKEEDILRVAARLSVGKFRIKDIEEAFSKNPELIQIIDKSYNELYTTTKIVEMERAIVQRVISGQKQLSSLYEDVSVIKEIARYELKHGFKLTRGQKEAVGHILTTQDQIVAIQGDAGTGKTTMLDVVRSIAANKEIVGLSFTGKAASEIQEASGIQSRTIASVLHSHGIEDSLHNKLVVVDEASMLSIKDMDALLKRCNDNTRLVLIGDTKQLQTIGQGKIFSSLQEHEAINTVRMSEVQRQKDPDYLAAVNKLGVKDVDAAFKQLDDKKRIHEIVDSDARFQAITQEYMTHPKSTIIVTATNGDRNELNKLIRNELLSQGKVQADGKLYLTREVKSVIGEDKHYADSYKIGDVIVANGAGILGTAGTDGYVTAIDYIQHKLSVTDTSNNIHSIDLKKHGQDIQVYTRENRTFAKGDKVLFLKNDRGLGVKNGQTGYILNINAKGILKVKLDNNKEVSFNPTTQYSYLSHGYALTDYKSQGQTAKHVIYHADTTKIINFNQAYVGITRGTESVTIYTNNKIAMQKKIHKEQIKTTTLDYVDYANQSLVVESSSSQPATAQEQAADNWTNNAIDTQNVNVINKADEITQAPPLSEPTTSQIIDTVNNLHQDSPYIQAKTQKESQFYTKEVAYWDVNVINDYLATDLERVLDYILDGRRTKTGNQYRYGKNGSLSITMSGSKQGYWHDFETNEGGKSLLSLIQRELNLDFKTSLDYAASLLGLSEADKMKEVKLIPKKTVEPEQFDVQQQKMIKIANAIAAKAVPAQDTLVQDYLTARGITAKLPSSIEFVPELFINKYKATYPAMVVKLHDEKGTIQSVHVTLLDMNPKNNKISKANVDKAKLKFGPSPSMINISLNTKPPTTNLTLIAEGLETALSIKSALPECDVKSALDKGGFSRIDINHIAKDVVLCLDNDLKDWREDKVINSAATRLIEAGKSVWIALPDSINGQKTDFNDVLQSSGIEDIIKTINTAEKYHVYQPELTQDRVDSLLHNANSAIEIRDGLHLTVDNNNLSESTAPINKADVAKNTKLSHNTLDVLTNEAQYSLDRVR